MIIIGSRIARIKGKFYDLGTTNHTFLRVAKDLQTLGIKNYYFLLEIKDPSIININPHSVDKDGHTTLSKDQIARVVTECARNPWYYLREVSRIPEQGGTAVPYRANRGNIAQTWCILHGIDSWLCLPRQQGKTESALAIEAWAYIFGTSNSEFIFINKDGGNAKANLRRLGDQIDYLPEYMQSKSFVNNEGVREKGKDNATEMANPINNNRIIIKPKATSYDHALSLARGLTAPILHFDEPEFTQHIKTIVSNSVSTYETAARNAKRNGAMYARIFSCTPGDLDSSAGQEAQDILDHTIKWTERFYDMTEDELERFINNQGESCNKIVYIEYSYRQIGLTESWLKNISAKIGDPLTTRREILLQRLHGSTLSPFDREDLEYIIQVQKEPISEFYLLEYYRFDVYKQLDKSIPYLVGVDCAAGKGNGDNNAITILNPYTLEPDAEFECSYIGETKYEQLLIELVQTVIPRAVLVIEANSMGDGIIDHLLHSPISNRLYYDKAKDLIDDTARSYQTVESMLKRHAALKQYYGVWTGEASRDQMMDILMRHVHEYKEKFVTRNITRDLSRLIRKTNGRIEAGTGSGGTKWHDDSIMSYLFTLYVWYHGNNLEIFGIQKGLTDDIERNQGLKRVEEINSQLVDQGLLNEVKSFEEKQRKGEEELNWDNIMKKAIQDASKKTYDLYQAKMIDGSIYDTTPDAVLDTYDDGSIPLDFFSEINNM